MRYRVADVCVVRRSGPFEAVVTVAPLLCIEVLSPDDRMSAMMEKIDDYLAMGVKMVWVIDPWRLKAYVADALGYKRVEMLPIPETEIQIAIREVFSGWTR